MTRAATSILGGVLACLLLVGCTGADPASPGASSTPEAVRSASASAEPAESPSPSPTPTVEPPERPAALDDDGVEGAKAAAEYIVLLDSYIMKTNDTAAYEQLSHPACETCTGRFEQAREISESGYSFTGGEAQVRVLHAYEQDRATGIYPLDVEVIVDPVEVLDPEGRVYFEEGRTEDQQRFEVMRSGDGWLVVAIVDLDEVDQ